MIRAVNPASGWKVLVVDKPGLKILGACCGMLEIQEEGVTIVENIELSRRPMRTYVVLNALFSAVQLGVRKLESPR